MESKKELLVIIPANNEEQNISDVLRQLEEQAVKRTADILIIDDASSDKTGQIIQKGKYCMARNVFCLGYGSSLQLGYRYALQEGYRYLIQMDADGQHDVCNIPIIYQRLRQQDKEGQYPDIVLASRFLDGSSDFPVSILKRIAFAWFRFLTCMVTGRRIADPTTGLQGLSRKAFSYYAGYQHFDDRYPDANMVIQMLLLGFRVAEIPAVMHRRAGGKSMHSGINAVWYMCRMFFDIPAIVFRIKGLRKDADMVWKEDKVSEE